MRDFGAKLGRTDRGDERHPLNGREAPLRLGGRLRHFIFSRQCAPARRDIKKSLSYSIAGRFGRETLAFLRSRAKVVRGNGGHRYSPACWRERSSVSQPSADCWR
jgi:hypothetical protein